MKFKKGIIPVVIGSILFFIVMLFFMRIYHNSMSGVYSLNFLIQEEEKSESIVSWFDGGESYYVFLPSYASMSNVYFDLEESANVYIAGELLADGTNLEKYQTNSDYAISFGNWDEQTNLHIRFVKSENLATMYIETDSKSMDYVNEDKENKESGNITVYSEDGKLEYADLLKQINGRGNASWTFNKKSYSITLSDTADLLGLGQGETWVLIANYSDKTNIRNKLVFDLAKELGMEGTPDCRWVDLYLNGKYNGLYLLCEKIEIAEDRLDIEETSSGLDSSFVVSMELESRMVDQSILYVATENGQAFRIHQPEAVSTSQLNMMLDELQGIENALLSEDGIDSNTGKSWLDYIDLDSWVNKYLIEEIFENQDGGAISQYFYRNNESLDSKIYAGPVWDYDRILGNGDKSIKNPNCLLITREWKKYDFYTPWYGALYEKPEFYNRMIEIYQQKYVPLLNELLTNKISAYAEEIQTASENNRIRWYSYFPDTCVQDEITYLTEFFAERLDFLNGVWIEQKDYCSVSLDEGDETEFLHFAVERGNVFTELPELEDTNERIFEGWYDKSTGQIFDVSQPITEDMDLYAVWTDVENNSPKAFGLIIMDMITIIPLVCFTIFFAAAIFVEFRRNRGSRRKLSE